MMRKLLTLLCCLFWCIAYCQVYNKGVSKELAAQRAQTLSDVHYDLIFDIPKSLQFKVGGTVVVNFCIAEKCNVVLDFQGKFSGACIVNGKKRVVAMRNEHIVIPAKMTKKGMNTVEMSFACQDKAFVRKADFVYTQLAPDKASACFPCFDQPDLPATFTTQMNVPEGWKSLIRQTEYAIPLHLYSFMAGRFEQEGAQRNGYVFHVFHRETDAQKTSQLPKIIDAAAASISWMEGYTGLKYPFDNFGIFILPGDQQEGMNYPGAIQLSGGSIFISQKPSGEEQMGRMQTIARETSRQWLGNLVTMISSKDAATSHLLTDFLTAKMTRHQYPKMELEALSQGESAMMRMLEDVMGAKSLQRGVQKYLSTHYFEQASWPQLVESLDQAAPDAGVRQFCEVWMKEKGMPEIRTSYQNGQLVVSQKDASGRGAFWRQKFDVRLIYDLDRSRTITVDMNQPTVSIDIGKQPSTIIPNYDGRGYGHFTLDPTYTQKLPLRLMVTRDDQHRYALLLTLFDNYQLGRIPPSYFGELYRTMVKEKNPLIMQTAISHMIKIAADRPTHERQTLEQCIMDLLAENRRPEFQQTVVRQMARFASSAEVKERLRQAVRAHSDLFSDLTIK